MNETLQQIQTAYLNGLAEEAQIVEEFDRLTARREAILKARPMQLGGMQALQLALKNEAEQVASAGPTLGEAAPEPDAAAAACAAGSATD